jgi:hypothetical protein
MYNAFPAAGRAKKVRRICVPFSLRRLAEGKTRRRARQEAREIGSAASSQDLPKLYNSRINSQ